MTIAAVTAALLEALTASGRAPPLRVLARPKYPGRELRPTVTPDGSVTVTLYKWGWEYKHRGPRPKHPPPADTEGIQQALNQALAPTGLYIQVVTDLGEFIKIDLEDTNYGEEEHPYRTADAGPQCNSL